MRPIDCKLIAEDCSKTRWAMIVFCLFMAGSSSAQDLRTQCGVQSKSQVELIDSSHSSYAIHMGGNIDGEMTRDPMGYWAYDQYWEPNVSVRMENIGETPVVNPWLQRSGSVDTRRLRSIVDSIIRPGMSEKEKARRLWEYEVASRFHATTQDDEVGDVVKRVNVYGYTLCYDESKDISDLWRAAGLKVRKGYPTGHSLAEVFYEGEWHLLDSDESIISLLRDNETIASESQVVSDHDLMKRTHTYGILANDDRLGDESSAALLYWEGERTGEQPSLTKHTMDFTLRPGESITWAWNPANRYHAMPFAFGDEDADGWNKHWRVIAHVMDGEMTYAPDLTKDATFQYLHLQGVEKQTVGVYGAGLYLHSENGIVDVPVKSAYPVVGGRLDVDFSRSDPDTEGIEASLSFDGGKSWTRVWSATPGDYSRIYADLNPYFKKTDPARYEYILRLTLRSRAIKPSIALKGFYLSSMLQMAPLAMPGVTLGENRFDYSDADSAAGKIRITHTWNECDADIPIPLSPIATFPQDHKVVSGSRVRFEWRHTGDPAPTDYEFELSEFADMRWALSSNFHKLISRTSARGSSSYTLPQDGLLNAGQSYYWRVRARSKEGVWGAWSKTWSFSVIAPSVPVNVNASFDSATRAVKLEWQPGNGGAVPTGYKIYGSAERGFSASDQPYFYNAGLAGTLKAPGNLLLVTEGPVSTIALPEELWRAYYRVVAVDSEGRTSGVSAMAELPHPLIVTKTLPLARRKHYYEARIATSASIGHLVSADEDGKSYQMKFRSGDDLVFSLQGAPEGFSIDNNGVITGFLPDKARSNYDLIIGVQKGTGGARDSLRLKFSVAGDKP